MELSYIVNFLLVNILGVVLFYTGKCQTLRCWHCIADNCEGDPSDNYKASEKECLQGQICQKVYFEMYSVIDQVKYKSLVRSCAEECAVHNDFSNCTDDLYMSRGCIKRSCCDDEDLCNAAFTTTSTAGHVWLLVAVCIASFVLNFT